MAICGACGAGNREGRRFCAACGTALAVQCQACGVRNEAGEQFCGDCGAPIPGPAVSPALPAPVPVVEPSREGERKQVTVFFADVSGSMDLQAGLDPEEWAKVMDRFWSLLSEGVQRYGGTVDKFTGDGIMALFGAPTAHEDHARRACLAALAISSAVSDYAAELRRTLGLGFHVRIGLNSGEVVTGGVGGSYTAVGHTVGLAQRMEALAEPGRAYLCEHTATLVAAHFTVSDLGLHEVKGSPVPVRVFTLDGVAPQARRSQASGPLVGRDGEMAELEAALAGAEAGRAQVVGVVGQAGVGKSRLCDEFARRCVERGLTVRRAAGLAHATSVPMLPILELLRDYFGISAADSPAAARERVAGRLLLLDPEFADSLPLVFDFLEVADPDRPAPRLAPEARLRRIFEILRRLTQRRTEREVMVVLLEDLHWFDAQSAAFLDRLIAQFPGSRTLVLTNFRPEFTAAWLGASYYRSLPLSPLDGEAADGLLSAMLGRDASLAPVVPLITERTGGNPFFVEEMVRDLIEAGTLLGVPGDYRLTRPVSEIKVPRTVHVTLAARIDRLPEQERRVLQTAAVIGRTFPAPILAAVTGTDVDEALTSLCRRELLQATESDNYRFWHPLTQEVAAATLLTERRSAVHAAVARALVDAEPDRLNENAALIATHWEAAGDDWEAAQWNARAADQAYRHDIAESMRRWQATIGLLGSVEHTEALRLGVRARSRLVRFGARFGMDEGELRRLLQEGRSLSERLDDPYLAMDTTVAAGSALFWRGHCAEALEEYLRLLAIAESQGDDDVLIAATVAVAVTRIRIGPLLTGLQEVERALRASGGDPERGGAFFGYSPMGPGLFARAEILGLLDEKDEGRRIADEATRLVRDRAELEWLGWLLSLYAQLATTAAEYEAALLHATEALQIADESANPANRVIALRAQGISLRGLGRFDDATAALRQGLDEARSPQVALFDEAVLLAHLALAHLGAGRLAEAAARADEGVEVARRQGASVVECHAHLVRAQVGQASGAPGDQVSADVAAGLALVEQTGAVTYEPGLRRLGDDRG